MAGTPGQESGVAKLVEPMSSRQSGEALAEWRSSDQVQNGVPSTSPPYWDVDETDDCGPKPSELYGKHTWKIDKFSQINKRELRSNSFEVGGYKWYILIYPQGCDVCNHLSLFLCVANHDKLLPGWSHFAQFTISVVNKDPKKSKYSDTLHRFWKKEHDWGWKKFMELSKVLDGFVDADTLTIKAQVQVIRERADRPFRCLDCLYRRELVRVYLTNVEQICRRFVEERRSKLGKLIEDKARWASFCAFWMGVDKEARLLLSKDKKDVILRVVVKHFFVEKEVTSTLVMDSLYSGLKALECQTKSRKGRGKSTDVEELPVPIVRMEDDMFVLVDDVLQLLERAALEPLPPKDEKGPQNRTKDGSSGEDFNKDSVERDERRLTELGRRTIEIFILAHIFSKIEVAYKEAVAFERQEELIREEEAAWLAEIEQKAKRAAAEKEKKLKKKQGKQKRNTRKGKDKEKTESNVPAKDENQQEAPSQEREVFRSEEAEKAEIVADLSDVSDSVDGLTETPQPDSEDREASPVNWDTDTSEVHPPTEASGCGVGSFSALHNGKSEKNSSSLADDSSSTCSTDSVPSVVTNGPYRGNGTHPKQKNQKSPSRGRSRRGKVGSDTNGGSMTETNGGSSTVTFQRNETNGGSKTETALNAVVTSLQDRMKELEQHIVEKEKVVPVQSESSGNGREDTKKPSKEKTVAETPSPSSPPKSPAVKSESKPNPNPSPASPVREVKSASPPDDAATAAAEPSGHKIACPKPTAKQATQQAPLVSRPLSAPLIPAPRPTTTVAAAAVSTASTAPVLARSLSAAGRLGPDGAHGSVPPVQSYRNVMMGTPVSASSSTQTPNSATPPEFYPPSRTESNSARPSRQFEAAARHDLQQNGSHQMIERPQRDGGTSVNHHIAAAASLPNDPHHFYNPMQDHFLTGLAASTSGRLGYQSTVSEEFPHLDIINDLLDDEKGLSRAMVGPGPSYQNFSNGPGSGHHHLSRHFTFPGNVNLANEMDPLASSCRYERTQSYHNDGYHHTGYGLLDGRFDPVRDTGYSQANLRGYQNGHMDPPYMPNQWHVAGPDMFSLGMRNMDSDGYGYHIPDYPNVESSVNGYTVFRPSNGH